MILVGIGVDCWCDRVVVILFLCFSMDYVVDGIVMLGGRKIGLGVGRFKLLLSYFLINEILFLFSVLVWWWWS